MDTTNVPFPLYIAAGSFFAYSVLIPEAGLSGDYIDDLMKWNFMVSEGWGYGYHYENGKPQKAIFPPLNDTGTNALDRRQPIIYYRRFEGYSKGEETYLELDQRIAHILGLHWYSKMSAYCKLDHLGDIKTVIQNSITDKGLLSVADLSELNFYMFLTDSAIVRVFDIMRFKGISWPTKKSSDKIIHLEEKNTELHARLVTALDTQSYLRGFQIIRRSSPDNLMQRVLEGKDPIQNEYAPFIALDWKHKRVHECSCSPKNLASYFEESDLPFQVTPAFFRPEILLKYKQHPDKYTVEQREVLCRGTWSLRYDINEDGQVHAYLCDLAYLPYEEQLYWKSFNEPPKNGISKRAYKTDFLAEWDTDYDPLYSLRMILEEFPYAIQYGTQQPIWKIPKGANPISRLSYVVTDSPKEWEDQLLELSRIIVDNLDKGNIRKLAKLLRCDDPKLGSLKLLRACLLELKVDSEVVDETMQPLEDIWLLRSKGIAHFGDSIPKTDLRTHFSTLLVATDKAMRNLSELINQGLFNIPDDD